MNRSLFPALSHPQRRMPWLGIGGLPGQLFGQLKSVVGKVVGRAMHPLLQSPAGIEPPAESFGLTRELPLALQLEVCGQAAQAAHLLAHLAGRSLRRAAQARIECTQPVDHWRQLGLQRRARRVKSLSSFDGNRASGQ